MTTIHDCQLLDEDIDGAKMLEHDVPVDIIVTPTQVTLLILRLMRALQFMKFMQLCACICVSVVCVYMCISCGECDCRGGSWALGRWGFNWPAVGDKCGA